ncbi:hypothetical protein tinsulaeT_12180 [Thalassotalea insulae]|uniref:Diguanylate cyclase/phosphodiesterase n=1 Tax=Thalassotalea insulae TaxID=2056778 RepID=A0ABQ6GPG2_9GAMM|nr:EAL domain-containing protein [Thalassotalea insulae]GLX77878.1 hypothetical protein tinsulaeT_12180 [Thalassotalea insulae]
MASSAAQIEKHLFILVCKTLLIIACASLISWLLPFLVINTQSLFYAFLILVVWSFAALSVWLFARHFKACANHTLREISYLEFWAEQSTVSGQYQKLTLTNNLLNQTVDKLLQQLEQASYADSQFDARLRANLLLDKQTGIGNREFFNNRLEALLKEEDVQGAVYFIQFNGFDVIHSLYGEKQVNILLDIAVNTVKQRLLGVCNYYLARRSEYELAVIIPGIFIIESEKLADKLLTSLSTLSLPIGVNHDEFIHIGVSYFSHAENSYQVKSEADMALRSAQLHGPSQWFMYDPGEVENVRAKGSLQWRTFLTKAISNNAFVVFFQPVIAKDGVRILHHEVLSKVRDVDGSLISARVFLPMAKQCGLVKTIDLLVLEQVCRILLYDKEQQDHCSLNFSIESLLAQDFKEQLVSILQPHQALASRLIVEISEYHIANHLQELKPVFESLHQLGVKLLVDKVGQYVENAHYLKFFPIDFMKLHRSIVMNIHRKPENQIFVQSLQTICATNQVEVYALGVENNEEWQMLLKLGVSGGQGHFFTEPVAQVAKAIHLL